MALGQAIVRQLERDTRTELSSRWMAHHLAELIQAAERGEGEERRQAEQRASELILKLWTHRQALPGPADPLGGYRNAIAVLGAMLPSANPWRRFRGRGSAEDLLNEMVGSLTSLVMSGLLLTRPLEMRRIADVEWDALSEEERFLAANLDAWLQVAAAKSPDDFDLDRFLDALESEEVDESSGPNTVVEPTGAREVDAEVLDVVDADAERAAILSNLEAVQAKVGDLIALWKAEVESSAAQTQSGE